MTDYTKEHKKRVAEQSIKLQKAEMQQKEIAEIYKIPLSTLKHWIKDFKDGKFDKVEKPTITKELKALKEIDIRPELEKINLTISEAIKTTNESLRALTEGMVKVCIRLDSIYQKNTEDHESFDSLLVKGFEKIGNNKKS